MDWITHNGLHFSHTYKNGTELNGSTQTREKILKAQNLDNAIKTYDNM